MACRSNWKEFSRGKFGTSNQLDNIIQQFNNNKELKQVTINTLKHRLLVFLYRRAALMSQEDGSAFHVRKFHQNFDHFRSLRLWKMQLLDETHLFLKYASEEVVTLRAPEPNSQTAFFVVYNMESAEVITQTEFASFHSTNDSFHSLVSSRWSTSMRTPAMNFSTCLRTFATCSATPASVQSGSSPVHHPATSTPDWFTSVTSRPSSAPALEVKLRRPNGSSHSCPSRPSPTPVHPTSTCNSSPMTTNGSRLWSARKPVGNTLLGVSK